MVMAALIRIRDFRKSCTPDNPWLSLYTSLPDELDFINDTELVHKLIEEIKVYPDRQPEVTLSHMEEKETFMNTLYMPLRLKLLMRQTIIQSRTQTLTMKEKRMKNDINDTKNLPGSSLCSTAFC